MNGFSIFVFVCVLVLGGIFCYLAGIFVVEALRRINPTWVGAVPPALPPAQKKKTKLVPRRKIPANLLKAPSRICMAGLLFFSPLDSWARDLSQMDGVRTKLWPVWARPGNDNVLSRIKYFGEKHALFIECDPEKAWRFWLSQGNEHLLKRRKMCCGSTI